MNIPEPVIWIVGGLAAVYGADLLLGSTNMPRRTVRLIEAEKRCAQHYVYKQYIDALDYCHVAAKIGGLQAKATLGEMYFHGRATQTDHAAAYDFALPAARGGDPRAQYVVGAVLLERGRAQEGRDWLAKAAASCHASAAPAVAASYLQPGAEDPFRAYIWNGVSNPQYAASDLAKKVLERRAALEPLLTAAQRSEAARETAAIRAGFDAKCP